MQLRADIYLGNLGRNKLTSLQLCDACLQVRFCGKTHTTTFVAGRNDPQWFQTLIIQNIDVPWPLKYSPSIYCKVYINKDEAIGQFEISGQYVYNEEEKR
eukprot:485191_1